MNDETTAWVCPKDGTTMEPLGRRGRGGAWRCPSCRSVFLDVEAMQRRRDRRFLVVAPFVVSVGLSLLATFLVRRLRRRSITEPVA